MVKHVGMPTSYTYEQCVLYEVLREAINACSGAYLHRIFVERQQSEPDQKKIDALMREVARLIDIRESIAITDVRNVTEQAELYSRLHMVLSSENQSLLHH